MIYQNQILNTNCGSTIRCMKYGRVATLSLTAAPTGVMSNGDTFAVLPEGFEPVFNVYAPSSASRLTWYRILAGTRNLTWHGANLTAGYGQSMTVNYITAT